MPAEEAEEEDGGCPTSASFENRKRILDNVHTILWKCKMNWVLLVALVLREYHTLSTILIRDLLMTTGFDTCQTTVLFLAFIVSACLCLALLSSDSKGDQLHPGGGVAVVSGHDGILPNPWCCDVVHISQAASHHAVASTRTSRTSWYASYSFPHHKNWNREPARAAFCSPTVSASDAHDPPIKNLGKVDRRRWAIFRLHFSIHYGDTLHRKWVHYYHRDCFVFDCRVTSLPFTRPRLSVVRRKVFLRKKMTLAIDRQLLLPLDRPSRVSCFS